MWSCLSVSFMRSTEAAGFTMAEPFVKRDPEPTDESTNALGSGAMVLGQGGRRKGEGFLGRSPHNEALS